MPAVLEGLESRLLLAETGYGTGLIADIYAGDSLANLAATRQDAVVNFSWTSGTVGGAVAAAPFSLRWTGRVQAQFTETYTFHVESDGGVRLWVNGQQILDSWDEAPVAERTGAIALTANEIYDIRLDYRNPSGGATTRLSWSSPSTPKELLPTEQLYPSGGWEAKDVGSVGIAGSATSTGATVFNISGSGVSSATADELHFLSQLLRGDVQIKGRITPGAGASARGGFMFRNDTSTDSAFAALWSTGSQVIFQYRKNKGEAVQQVIAGTPASPALFLRMVRNGPLASAYTSATGADGSWTHIGTAAITGMGPEALAGMASTSGSDAALANATFADVGITPIIPIGAGLKEVKDTGYTTVFTDMVKQTRGFNGVFDPNSTVPVDAEGWPTTATDFSMIFQTGIPESGHTFTGTYKIIFKGQATLDYADTPGGSIQNKVYDPGTDTTTADLVSVIPDDLSFWLLNLRFFNAVNVRDIRVIRPGYDPATAPLFSTEFLEHIKPLTTLRFMDWLRINSSAIENWADRTLPTNPIQSGTMAWEYIIDLCNVADKDLWVNIPYKANEDYVRQLARLIRDRLEPDRAVYIEYANEVWNGLFPAFNYVWNNFLIANDEGATNLNYDNRDINQSFTKSVIIWRASAQQTRQVGLWFAEEFGPGSLNTRVRPILCAQAGRPDTFRYALEYLEANYGSPKDYLYGIGGAPYYDQNGKEISANTADKVLASLQEGLDAVSGRFDDVYVFARMYGIRWLTYEGGPNTYGFNNIQAKREAQLDPRQKDLVKEYLNRWYSNGGGLFTWYVAGATNYYAHFGAWGLTNDMSSLNTSKIQGIQEIAAAPLPNITSGFPAPGTFRAKDFIVDSRFPYAPNWLSVADNSFFDYLVRAPEAGTFYFSAFVGTPETGQKLRLLVNGLPTELDVPVTGGFASFLPTAQIPLQLAKGHNSIRILGGSGYSFYIDTVNLTTEGTPVEATSWTNPASGNWADAGNWNNGVPNNPTAYARLSPDPASVQRTLTLTSATSLGTLRFEDPDGYRIAGTSPLAFTGSGNITVIAGNNEIAAPLSLTGNVEVVVPNGSTLTISGALSLGAGARLTKTGAGALVINGGISSGAGATLEAIAGVLRLNTDEGTNAALRAAGLGSILLSGAHHAGAVTVDSGGTVSILDAFSRLRTSSLALTGTGILDIGEGAMIVQATAGTRDSVFFNIQNAVRSARNSGGGLWQGSGIRSTAGGFKGVSLMANWSGNVPIVTSFVAETVDANTILLRGTPVGDANLDTLVNADDYFKIDLANQLGLAGGYAAGDFDYSGGAPNADDYFLIDLSFLFQNGPSGAPTPQAAPTPLSPADELFGDVLEGRDAAFDFESAAAEVV